MSLTPLERSILLFEATWRPRPAGPTRVSLIRERFDLGPAQYRRILDEACRHPDAMSISPSVVARRGAVARPLRPVRARGELAESA